MVKEDLVEVLSAIDLTTTSAQSLLKNSAGPRFRE